MKLNKLPVLIRTEVTEAVKKADLPAIYSRALVALETAVSELSFGKLKQLEISVEGLATWAKAHQDDKMSATARELRYRSRRVAIYIAKRLANLRARKGVQPVLLEAGYSLSEIRTITALDMLPDTPNTANMNVSQIKIAAIGKGNHTRSTSEVYRSLFSDHASPLCRNKWFRDNNARGIAKRLENETEIAKARQNITLMHAWCEEFLKNLPRKVSKARVEA
jgi:hypothetical protein